MTGKRADSVWESALFLTSWTDLLRPGPEYTKENTNHEDLRGRKL